MARVSKKPAREDLTNKSFAAALNDFAGKFDRARTRPAGTTCGQEFERGSGPEDLERHGRPK